MHANLNSSHSKLSSEYNRLHFVRIHHLVWHHDYRAFSWCRRSSRNSKILKQRSQKASCILGELLIDKLRIVYFIFMRDPSVGSSALFPLQHLYCIYCRLGYLNLVNAVLQEVINSSVHIYQYRKQDIFGLLAQRDLCWRVIHSKNTCTVQFAYIAARCMLVKSLLTNMLPGSRKIEILSNCTTLVCCLARSLQQQ